MKRNRLRVRKALLFTAFLVSAAMLGALLFRKYETSRKVIITPPQGQEAGTIPVTLFFADAAGEGLRREVREIDACEGPVACSEAVIEELANGPVGELSPTLPASFSLRSVQMDGKTLVVDLEKGSFDGLPEGSSAELAMAYSIVDTLAFNFPAIDRVKFLVDGAPAALLKGHLDLREPLRPDYQLEKK